MIRMPRQLRIQYEGALYHVMSRGDRGRPIFLDDVDRQDFLKTLAEACQKTAGRARCFQRAVSDRGFSGNHGRTADCLLH